MGNLLDAVLPNVSEAMCIRGIFPPRVWGGSALHAISFAMRQPALLIMHYVSRLTTESLSVG